MAAKLSTIIDELPRFEQAARALKDVLLANLVMVSEIPSPTFGEEDRLRFLQDRFSECGLANASRDEVGNCLGVLNGANADRNILAVAHADTVFPASVDHTITVETGRVVGPGVGDNSLGVAMLATLPNLLDALDLELDANLILMGETRSLGKGNLEGLRFFLANNRMPIAAGVCLEGLRLGRLSIRSLGMLRGEIRCDVPPEFDWTRFGVTGAVLMMNEVINSILQIPVPRRPATSIVLGSVRAGSDYGVVATTAELKFEIRSESAELVEEIHARLEDIVSDASAQSGAQVSLEIVASREPGGIGDTHRLARTARGIMKALDLKPRLVPSVSELSAFIDRKIPALTVGMTTGEKLHELREAIDIEPVFKGAAQLVALLLAIDRGATP